MIYKFRYCLGYVALLLVCHVVPDTSRVWWWLLPHAGLFTNFDWDGKPTGGPKETSHD